MKNNKEFINSVSIGDIVIVRSGIRSFRYHARKIVRETKTMFILDNDYRFRKDGDGNIIKSCFFEYVLEPSKELCEICVNKSHAELKWDDFRAILYDNK